MDKVLVVDDEEIIRTGIVNHIKKRSPNLQVIGEAENGMQALELCQDTEPEIVITDVLMPEMDGIQFIRELRKRYSDVHVIFISGHDEFTYAQSAMRLGVTDYLLKPFLPEKLEKTLLKVKENLDKQKNFFNNMKNLQNRLEESMPIVRERFYIDMVSNQLTMEDIEYKSSFLNLELFANYYTVAILKVNKSKVVRSKEISKEELIQFFLMDTVGQLFSSDIKTFVFGNSDHQLGIIICGNYNKKHQFFQSMNNSLSKLIESMAEHYNVVIYASIGKIYDNILKMPLAYNEAEEAMDYSFASEASTVIHYDEIFLSGTKTYEKPSKLLKDVILYTKIGYQKQAMEKIEAIFEYYKQNCVIEPNFIKTDVIEVVLGMQKYIEESKGNNCFLYQQNMSPYEQIQNTDALTELQDLLKHFAKLTIKEVKQIKEGQSTSIIEKLKSISLDNISNKEFNLDYAAAILYISPNYLRQLFKQQTGETFVEYLTAQRMKKAAELISDPSIKISEVSEQVGYGSQSYFSKCFKKFFRVTPSEYRDDDILSGKSWLLERRL